MTKETGFYLDMSDFDKKFNKVVEEAIPEDAGKGLVDGMNEWLRDSIELPPQAPKKIGDLWAAIADTVKLFIQHKILSVIGGFNIKYARRHHEVEPGTFKYTVDKGATQPGPKFMQSKMVKYKDKYMEIVANSIRRRGK